MRDAVKSLTAWLPTCHLQRISRKLRPPIARLGDELGQPGTASLDDLAGALTLTKRH